MRYLNLMILQPKILLLSSFLLFTLSFSVKSENIELVHAQGNSTKIIDGSMVSTLYGDVEIKMGSIIIKSDTTIWKRKTGEISFLGNMLVTRPKQIISCDNAFYRPDSSRFELRGSVYMIDSVNSMSLSSDSADYYLETDSLFVAHSPKIIFGDSLADEPIKVLSDTLRYSNRNSKAELYGNVKILGNAIKGRGESLTYYSFVERATILGKKSYIEYDGGRVIGDSITLDFIDGGIRKVTSVKGNPNGYYKDKDREKTTVIGDWLNFDFIDGGLSKITAKSKSGKSLITRDTLKVTGDNIVTIFADGDLASLTSKSKELSEIKQGDNNIIGKNLYCRFSNNELESLRVHSDPKSDEISKILYGNDTIVGKTITCNFSNGELDSLVSLADTLNLEDSTTLYYESSFIRGGTLKINAKEGSLDSVTVFDRTPFAKYRDDDQVTNIYGDTLTFIFQDSSLHKIISMDNSLIEKSNSYSEIDDILSGSQIIITIKDSITEVKAIDKAKSIYSDDDTRNTINGDTLMLNFDKKGAKDIMVIGKVQGIILLE